MNNKLAQLVSYVYKIDRRHIQFAYFALVFVGFIFMQRPSDGGGGSI